MKKNIKIFAFVFISSIVIINAFASTLSCYDVDGASIFGYDSGKWIFIGSITSEYDSHSIANEYGDGSEYNSNSITNEYGSFGSEYSSYSATNEYATKPPAIINNDDFIGFLTANEYMFPSIDPYKAIACAKKSYSSTDRDMVDTKYKNIPSYTSSSYSAPPTYKPSAPTPSKSCPANSSLMGNDCYCNSGYVINDSKNACVLKTPTCPTTSYYNPSDGKCHCNAGLVNDNGSCVPLDVWCVKSFGSYVYVKDGKCVCANGYSLDTSTNICKREDKGVVARDVPTTLSPKVSVTVPKIETKKNIEFKSVSKATGTAETPKVQTVSTQKNDTINKVGWFKGLFNWLNK